MNIISIVFIGGLLFLVPLAMHINTCRQGRDAKGKFTRQAKQVKKQLFYSELRKELNLS